jgi:hypothetical protein
MGTIETMLRRHPRMEVQRIRDYAGALDALAACVEVCTVCADACLAEDHVRDLRACIRITDDCADVCAITARLLTRQTETPGALVHAQLHACAIACQLCAEECERHASMHAHCRICAETCHRCQKQCNYLMGEISSSGTADPEDPLGSPGLLP